MDPRLRWPCRTAGSTSRTVFHQTAIAAVTGWSELWQKQDWWAAWLGLGTGFLLVSLLVTLAVQGVSFADDNRIVRPDLVVPLTTLRTWTFSFSFPSIGLTTRPRGLAPTAASRCRASPLASR